MSMMRCRLYPATELHVDGASRALADCCIRLGRIQRCRCGYVVEVLNAGLCLAAWALAVMFTEAANSCS